MSGPEDAGSAERGRPSILAWVLMGLVRFYQLFVSPLLHMGGARCRFTPTCSAYAIEAVRMNGAFRGGWQSIRRILRCHPWHPGGFDPPTPARPRTTSSVGADELEEDGRRSR